ncbi:MAG: hypothetical protein Q7R50_01080 [Dehalococcoidales bacterium]|nr:hypothetical protein [Dehalococcoidales bacterium]
MDAAEEIFNRLDDWRHLPAYQLERRADIFFALYLHDVIGRKTSSTINPHVIPEFPLKKADSMQSVKADYVAFSKDLAHVFLIELKTDCKSLDIEQLMPYVKVKENGFADTIDGLRKIMKGTKPKFRSKYLSLWRSLEQIYLKSVPGTEDQVRENIGAVIQRVRATSPCVHIYCILPTDPVTSSSETTLKRGACMRAQGIEVIDFAEFAISVDRHDDVFSKRFATSLRKWSQVEAGDSFS